MELYSVISFGLHFWTVEDQFVRSRYFSSRFAAQSAEVYIGAQSLLKQPSDFSGFWETFATFLTTFLGFWVTFASFPRLAGSSAGVRPHLYGISTTMCLQPQHFGCRRPPCKPYEGAGHTFYAPVCTDLLVDLLTRRHGTPRLTCLYAYFFAPMLISFLNFLFGVLL